MQHTEKDFEHELFFYPLAIVSRIAPHRMMISRVQKKNRKNSTNQIKLNKLQKDAKNKSEFLVFTTGQNESAWHEGEDTRAGRRKEENGENNNSAVFV